ncbi:MAG: M15 family metallopeptidase [Clostridia bacterium]
MNVKKAKKQKKNQFKKLFILIIIIFIVLLLLFLHKKQKKANINSAPTSSNTNNDLIQTIAPIVASSKEDDWALTLVNRDHYLPENYKLELSNIDDTRQFDSRAIEYLNSMINNMRKSGITNIWVQSSYRSIQSQENIFNDNVKQCIKKGMTQEEAEKETLKIICKPGTSDHNLGLAVDLNYVNLEFENTEAFKWLVKNAHDYGFILRYPKDKFDITNVTYEPWHWRYVGAKNAKIIKEKNFCLEEYINYITTNSSI